jgi:hypothetical protein
MVEASHSYSTGVQPCIQKQLLQDIQARGGIAAIIKSKRGALTKDILKSRRIYGEANTPLRKSITTKIGHWKALYIKGDFDDIICQLLGSGKENASPDVDDGPDDDDSIDSGEFSNSSSLDDSTTDSENENSPPKKTPKKSSTKSPNQSSAKKPPSTKPSPKPSPKPSTKSSTKSSTKPSTNQSTNQSTSQTEMAMQIMEKNSIASLKKKIGKFANEKGQRCTGILTALLR